MFVFMDLGECSASLKQVIALAGAVSASEKSIKNQPWLSRFLRITYRQTSRL
jgi:hypothetical protein